MAQIENTNIKHGIILLSINEISFSVMTNIIYVEEQQRQTVIQVDQINCIIDVIIFSYFSIK